MSIFTDIPNNPYIKPLGDNIEVTPGEDYSPAVLKDFFDYMTYFPQAIADTRFGSPNFAVANVIRNSLYFDYSAGELWSDNPSAQGAEKLAGSSEKRVVAAIPISAGGNYWPTSWDTYFEARTQVVWSRRTLVLYEDFTTEEIIQGKGGSFALMYAEKKYYGGGEYDWNPVVRSVTGSLPALTGTENTIMLSSSRDSLQNYVWVWGKDSYKVYSVSQAGVSSWDTAPVFRSMAEEREGKILYASGPFVLLENGELWQHHLNVYSTISTRQSTRKVAEDVLLIEPFYEFAAGAVDDSADGCRFLTKDGSWHFAECHNKSDVQFKYIDDIARWEGRADKWTGCSRFEPIPLPDGTEYPDYYGLEASRGFVRHHTEEYVI
jgi:hypothetical protein